MSEIHSAAGTKLSIATVAGAPATIDAAGFGAKTYVEVGEITNIGDFGATVNVINHSPLSNRIIQKFKGSINNGSGSYEFASKASDAGQILVKAASVSDLAYAVKIEEQDCAITYFMCLFTSFVKKIGTIDNVVAGSANYEITSAIVEIPV